MSSQLFNKLSKLNDSFISLMEKPIIKYGFLILVIINIICIDYVSTSYLEIFDIDSVKVIYAFLIAYYACFDPVYSIALTTLVIISIQELHNRQAKKGLYLHTKSLNSQESPIKQHIQSISQHIPQHIPQSNQQVRYNNNIMPNPELIANDKYIYDQINKHSLQKQPDINDNIIPNYDYFDDPAFKTLTNNIIDKSTLGNNNFIVTEQDLMDIQTNREPGVKQDESIQGFNGKIMNIQGLPNGFDPSMKY